MTKNKIYKIRDIEACLELATIIPDFANVDKDNIVNWLQKIFMKRGLKYEYTIYLTTG